MRPRIDLLTHPILFLALWLGLALSIAYSITPFNFSDPFTQSFPFFAESLAAVFFVLTWLLSLIHLRLNLKLNEQLAQQVQTHTLALKTLKSQHKNENSQIQTFIKNEQFAFWEWHINSKTAVFSPQWKKMIGLPKDRLLNSLNDLQARVHPSDKSSLQKRFLEILSGQQPFFECTHRIQHADGHYIWVHDKGQVFFDQQGRVEKLLALRLDVSAQKWIEDDLEMDAITIEHAFEGMAVLDAELNIVRCNQALSNILRQRPSELQGSDFKSLLSQLQTEKDHSILATIETKGAWRGELTLSNEKEEILLATRASIQKIFHETSQNIRYSFILSDITDLKKTQSILDTQANIDNVTGLPNRNKLYSKLQSVIETGQKITLMFLDLDDFKHVNDTFGHDVGDLLLKQAGNEIRKLLPKQAVLSRLGGDEFVFFYEQACSFVPATQIAQGIVDKLKEPFCINNQTLRIGCSIGIAHYPQQSADRQSLLKASDVAMYQAKRTGKNRYCEFSDALLLN